MGDTESHLNGPEQVEFYVPTDGSARKPLPQIVDIAAGESHSLALAIDGRVFSWGANLEGQLGYPTERPLYGDERDQLSIEMHLPRGGARRSRTSPSTSTSSSATNSPAKVAQLVEAPMTDREAFKLQYQPYPKEIGVGEAFAMLDAQSRFSVAVGQKGQLYTWGSGHSYQLGNEEMEDEHTPYQVELKTRKCFWARCGGQFTMFLLGSRVEKYF